MNVLITGAAGFLGSHLAQAYVNEGHRVTGIDNLRTSDGRNIAGLSGNSNFRFVEDDVCEGLRTSGVTPELILHFASPASPVDYAKDPVGTLRVNGYGTEHCCKLALASGARMIFASTSEIYGDPLVHPQPETYWGNVNSVGERSCYDEGKRFGEAMVRAYRRQHGVDARIVRIFNTYGPRMRADDGRVVPTFIQQALSNGSLTVFGDGRQTRSLCYVDDLVLGIRSFAQLDAPPYDIVNLGSEFEAQVNDIAEIIARLCEVSLRVEHRPLPSDDPSRRRPDLTRARAMLGWEPRTELEDGLRTTITWFKNNAERTREVATIS
ncbi:MAG TPA: NAD-dependent epimerase/dehydratase family protein [Candidatus Baltobacteraceae bacterium]|jgi:dTDP-glucose 4,6-dehydratase|nr:NAD-dependent epimerase/dehydratase family protein [Candidatus Baltobacteraceae bacterium]